MPLKPPTAVDAFPGDAQESRNHLVYHVDRSTGVRRLYTPRNVVKDVLEIAYTAKGHLGFARYYEKVA